MTHAVRSLYERDAHKGLNSLDLRARGAIGRMLARGLYVEEGMAHKAGQGARDAGKAAARPSASPGAYFRWLGPGMWQNIPPHDRDLNDVCRWFGEFETCPICGAPLRAVCGDGGAVVICRRCQGGY